MKAERNDKKKEIFLAFPRRILSCPRRAALQETLMKAERNDKKKEIFSFIYDTLPILLKIHNDVCNV